MYFLAALKISQDLELIWWHIDHKINTQSFTFNLTFKNLGENKPSQIFLLSKRKGFIKADFYYTIMLSEY